MTEKLSNRQHIHGETHGGGVSSKDMSQSRVWYPQQRYVLVKRAIDNRTKQQQQRACQPSGDCKAGPELVLLEEVVSPIPKNRCRATIVQLKARRPHTATRGRTRMPPLLNTTRPIPT